MCGYAVTTMTLGGMFVDGTQATTLIVTLPTAGERMTRNSV
jgi:hypothetical protein